MNATVPHADTVGHDPLEAAKPLLLLGWTSPSLLAARVALEQCLLGMAAERSLAVPERATIGTLVRMFENHQLLAGGLCVRTQSLNADLSRVAHGQAVNVFTAMQLIERTERRMQDLRTAEPPTRRRKGGAKC
ncbi:hypothetical protein [Aeoliella sp.]|uniref:hypothetical protein n=1 Tax=Aeoliella sp. TaxID=2795800 RepID=UPI003CCBA739